MELRAAGSAWVRWWPPAAAFSAIRRRTGILPRAARAGLTTAATALTMVPLLAVCGCGGSAPIAAVALARVDHDALMATVAGHRGKVVVLDCWSTSCPPCVRDFPRLVALKRRFGDAVACLSLSFDYEGIGSVAEVEPKVLAFLESVGARSIENLLSAEDADSLCRRLDLAGVPAVYVWRADGSLARRFDEDDAARRLGRPFTYDDVEALVGSLVEASGRR